MAKFIDTAAIVNVIGCIYNNPTLLDNEQYTFAEYDFENEFHKIIFGSIYNLYNTGIREINHQVIEDYLSQRPKKLATYKANKGEEYLEEVSKKVQFSTFDYYYQRLKKMTLFREYQKAGMTDLTWLYDVDNILDIKKKQSQEDFIDNHSLEELADIIDNRVAEARIKCCSDYVNDAESAGEKIKELIESYKERPAYGISFFGKYINTITNGAFLGQMYIRSAATNVGKAIPNYTFIPTINGFKTVESIKVGDYLIGQNGQPTQVLKTYPQQEKKNIWRVTFSDGRVAECCKDHLWEYRYETHRGKAYRVETTEEIYNRSLKLKNGFKDSRNRGYRFHIKLNEPVNYIEHDFSVHPYVMGAILGDGSLRYNDRNKALTFSSENEEIPNYIGELTNTIPYKVNAENYTWTFHTEGNHNLWIEDLLKDYPQLRNLKSENKFIPQDFFIGSIEQRYSLLQGLLDTDGNIDNRTGSVSIYTVSHRLRDDIITLCRSLGMVANYLIDKRPEKYTTGEAYKITIQCKKELKPRLFRLNRKKQIAEQYANSNKRCEYKDHLAIINIEQTKELVDMTCFTVDNDDHLFLMNDYIVTHNTRSMAADACTFAFNELYDIYEKKWVVFNRVEEPTLFISTEQDKDQMRAMCLAFLSGVPEDHITKYEYIEGEYERVMHAAEILERGNLILEHIPDFSIKDIEGSIKINKSKYGIKYVCFDYIHSSMKILSEISSSVKNLREDNILFLLSARLRDIADIEQVFILTSTQLNGGYVDADVYDQNLLRGAKSIADKADLGSIMLEVTKKDLESLQPLLEQGMEKPDIKLAFYKNRNSGYKDLLLWCKKRTDICRIEPMFVTTYAYELIQMNDLQIQTRKPKFDASAF